MVCDTKTGSQKKEAFSLLTFCGSVKTSECITWFFPVEDPQVINKGYGATHLWRWAYKVLWCNEECEGC